MAPVVLDSSPLLNNSGIPPPQPRRNLKRSASTASLLTPPRTVKRKGKRRKGRLPRSRSRASQRETDLEATDSDEASSLGNGTGRRLDFGHKAKKRRIGDLDARLDALIDSLDGDDSENPFWEGPSKTAGPADKEEKSGHERERSSSPPLVHFQNKALVSPPPSRRRKTVVEKRPPPPSTPKGKRRKGASPVRDSPNNPFLDDSPLSATADEPVEPRTPTDRAEKPSITYVFRGVRATFNNPLYNAPPEVHERSLLPVDHPDYSPDPACPPKLLFANAHKRRASPSPTRAGKSKSAPPAMPSTITDDEWDDSDDEELHVTPPKRLFH